jgi:hypothetical protein
MPLYLFQLPRNIATIPGISSIPGHQVFRHIEYFEYFDILGTNTKAGQSHHHFIFFHFPSPAPLPQKELDDCLN